MHQRHGTEMRGVALAWLRLDRQLLTRRAEAWGDIGEQHMDSKQGRCGYDHTQGPAQAQPAVCLELAL